jgi:Fe-S-cluster containining protein
MDFPCTGCGVCCQKIRDTLNTAEAMKSLPVLYEAIKEFPYEPNEDGSCSMLKDNRCSVYEDRPLLCNVRKLGELSGYHQITWYSLNALTCNILIDEAGLDESYFVTI